MNTRLSISVTAFLILSACAHAPPLQSETAPKSAAFPVPSSFEISYVLGHNFHKIVAEAPSPDQARAATYLDHELVKESRLEPQQYLGLYQRVAQLISDAKQQKQTEEVCRNPFSVLLKSGEEKSAAKGCRTASLGTSLSRIARETEVLLYSKK